MTARKPARHRHAVGPRVSVSEAVSAPRKVRARERAYRRTFVPCYALTSVLTPEQMEAVRPFLRETFTETWDAACGEDISLGGDDPFYEARQALRDASGLGATDAEQSVYGGCTATEGRMIERRFYARAKALSAPVIMAPPRRTR